MAATTVRSTTKTIVYGGTKIRDTARARSLKYELPGAWNASTRGLVVAGCGATAARVLPQYAQTNKFQPPGTVTMLPMTQNLGQEIQRADLRCTRMRLVQALTCSKGGRAVQGVRLLQFENRNEVVSRSCEDLPLRQSQNAHSIISNKRSVKH